MRILAITKCFPHPGHEGECIYHLHDMRGLAETNQVRVIAPVPWTERLRDWRRVGICRERIDGNLRIYHPTYWYTPKILPQHYGPCYAASIRKTVAQATANFTPDIVLGLWAHPDGWAAIQVARQFNVPACIRVIGSDVLVLAKNPRRRAIIAQTLQQADGINAVSADLARHVIALGVDPRKVHVAPEGIDMNLFRPGDRAAARAKLNLPQGSRMILFVGNLLFSKGCGVLIQACERLHKKGVPFQCALVGGGKDQAALHKMVQSANLSEKVTFVGRLKPGDLVDWYHAADLVTLPSFSEGMPNVLREALQCGRPFVATNVGGIPEISDPAVTRLVKPGDATGLADALEKMLNSPPVVSGEIAARYNINWEEATKIRAKFFQEVIDGRRPCISSETAMAGAI